MTADPNGFNLDALPAEHREAVQAFLDDNARRVAELEDLTARQSVRISEQDGHIAGQAQKISDLDRQILDQVHQISGQTQKITDLDRQILAWYTTHGQTRSILGLESDRFGQVRRQA